MFKYALKYLKTAKKAVSKNKDFTVYVVGIVALVLFFGTRVTAQSDRNSSSFSTSVKIMDFTKTSGGSGLVLESHSTHSIIITNEHVCLLIQDGGVIEGEFGVVNIGPNSYTGYGKHDLCLIKVKKDLGLHTVVATEAPKRFIDLLSIVGHPALLPTVQTFGHASNTQPIEVVVGFRECEEDDWKSDPLACAFLGGMPTVREFESTLVSATIMPGSSGSGVFNLKGELVGLVFAGQGGLGYAWTVPFQYLKDFLDVTEEYSRVPNAEQAPAESQESSIYTPFRSSKVSCQAYYSEFKPSYCR